MMETKVFSAVVLIFAAFAFTALPASTAPAPDLPYLVKDINLNMNIAGVSSHIGGASQLKMVAVHGMVYLIADDGNHGEEIWKSDGTAKGTTLVKDIYPGARGSFPAGGFTAVNGSLFFMADDGEHGLELWTSDGTAKGTTLVKDIYPGARGSSFGTFPGGFTAVNGGTKLVKDINPGVGDSYPSSFTDINGTFFFRAHDSEHGFELWKSNGTAKGTRLVKDINPGGGWAFPDNLTDVNGTLFFRADDGEHGQELWTSTGREAGTRMVTDINPGANGSFPAQFTDVSGTLFFTADDGVHGAELWALSEGKREGN
jgi:ELWxxDGT repeat protein